MRDLLHYRITRLNECVYQLHFRGEWEHLPPPQLAAAIAAVQAAALVEFGPGLTDAVAAYESLALYFDPLKTDFEQVEHQISICAAKALARRDATHVSARVHRIAVNFDPAHGLDLAEISQQSQLSMSDVVERFCATRYTVFAIGFAPGFPYLGFVDPALAMPRKTAPRQKVPAGSVAIADQQVGIYPSTSPGGWNIVGHSGCALFDGLGSESKPILSVGDTVEFYPTSDPQPSIPPDTA